MDHQNHPCSARPAVIPHRQRMIEDMTIRRFGDHTRRNHIRQFAAFTAIISSVPHVIRFLVCIDCLCHPRDGRRSKEINVLTEWGLSF